MFSKKRVLSLSLTLFLFFQLFAGENEANKVTLNILLDDSGSITSAGQKDLRNSLSIFIKHLKPYDTVKVSKFSNKIFEYEALNVEQLNVDTIFKKLSFKGQWTHLFEAIQQSLSTIPKSQEKESFMIVFSDGNDENNKKFPKDILKTFAAKNIPILFYKIDGRRADVKRIHRLVKVSNGIYSSGNIEPIIDYINSHRIESSREKVKYVEKKTISEVIFTKENAKKIETDVTHKQDTRSNQNNKNPIIDNQEIEYDYQDYLYWLRILLPILSFLIYFILLFRIKKRQSPKSDNSNRKSVSNTQDPKPADHSPSTKDSPLKRKEDVSGEESSSEDGREPPLEEKQGGNFIKQDRLSDLRKPKKVGINRSEQEVSFSEKVSQLEVVQSEIFDSFDLNKNKDLLLKRSENIELFRKNVPLVNKEKFQNDPEHDDAINKMHDEWAKIALGEKGDFDENSPFYRALFLGFLRPEYLFYSLELQVAKSWLSALFEKRENPFFHEIIVILLEAQGAFIQGSLLDSEVEDFDKVLDECISSGEYAIEYSFNTVLEDWVKNLRKSKKSDFTIDINNDENIENVRYYFDGENAFCASNIYLSLDSECFLRDNDEDWVKFHVQEIHSLVSEQKMLYILNKI